MNNIKYASIIPLIGGMTIAQQQVFGNKPEWLLSYKPFATNDSHLLDYFPDVPYSFIESSEYSKFNDVDVISTTCPCAGLSSLSTTSSSDNQTNDWMYNSSRFILENYRPKVLWGENAPRLATESGAGVLVKLYKIAKESGYSLSLYKTASRLHGNPQMRIRSFYFFWKGNKTPILSFVKRTPRKLIDVLNSIPKDATQQILVSKSIPSEDPTYRFILQKLKLSHAEFVDKHSSGCGIVPYVLDNNLYDECVSWLDKNDYSKKVKFFSRIKDKLDSGKNFMERDIQVVKDYIGAFVGHLPMKITHPIEDRFLTIRECLTIMDHPFDFELKDGNLKYLNHICQNVPVNTAKDMALEIKRYINSELPLVEAKGSVLIQNNISEKNNYLKVENNLKSLI